MKYVTVENMNVEVVEYNNERVLTTEQVSEGFECEPKQIQQNYNNNKDRFVEGQHYFELTGQALRDFKRHFENFELPIVNKFASHLILWTKRGVARHSKLLGTDKAWDMFDALEENYFNPKQQQPMSAVDMLVQSALLMKEHETKLAKLTEETDSIKMIQKKQQSELDTLNNVCTDGTKRQKLNTLVRSYANRSGVQYSDAWNLFKEMYNNAFKTNLKLKKTNYCKKNNIKKMSLPQFLEETNQLEDALRVAEKM